MTNENPSEKIIKLMSLSNDTLAGMICSKDNEIVRLKEMLAECEEQSNDKEVHDAAISQLNENESTIRQLNNLIDTLKQGNQKLINTIAYQAMQLAGELDKNG